MYPRLFEEQDSIGDIDVSEINPVLLRKKILGAGDQIKVEIGPSDYLYKVDGYGPDDLITWEYIMELGASLGYGKKLRKFIDDGLDINSKKEIDIVKRKRKGTKTIEAIKDYLPEKEIPYTHGEFWAHLIDEYEGDTTGPATSKSSKSYILDLTHEDYDDLNQFFTDRGKINELTDFVLNVPQSGDTLKTLEDFLRKLGEIIRGEDKVQIQKGANSKTAYLPKDQYENWKDDMVDYIGDFENPLELNEIYKDNILKNGTFLNYLFQLEPKGVGRGEFLLVYAIPNSSFSGGSEDYDVVVEGQAIYEVKEYSSTGESGHIRLGTHGKLSQFDFFQDVKHSMAIAKKIWDNLGPEKIKKIVGKYNFQYWKNMTNTANFNTSPKALPSAVNSGELPPHRLKMLIDWHYLNHMLIEEGPETEDQYTMAVLRGNNMPPKTVGIDPVKPDEIKDGKPVTITELEDQEKMFNELRTLKYIKDPHQLIEDLEDSPHNYFEKVLVKSGNQSLDFYFLIFRPNEIKVLTDQDFILATISQSSIKITEKGEGNRGELSAIQHAFKDYKKLVSDDAIEKDFHTFYRDKLTNTNESYYPRLINY